MYDGGDALMHTTTAPSSLSHQGQGTLHQRWQGICSAGEGLVGGLCTPHGKAAVGGCVKQSEWGEHQELGSDNLLAARLHTALDGPQSI